MPKKPMKKWAAVNPFAAAVKPLAAKKVSFKAAAAPSFDVNSLEDVLWFTVLDAAGPLPIHPGCEFDLKAMIAQGVQRMHAEGRTDAAAVHEARQSLRHYVTLMKAQAVMLNHPGFLGEDTKKAVDKQLDAKPVPFSLWPIWPLPGSKK
jgi:hypothetical protein